MTQTATAAQITYRKTKTGEWVAYGPAKALRTGSVTVTKKDGSSKTETVTRLGRPFAVSGVDMVYGYLAAKSTSSGRSTSACLCGLHRSYRPCKTDGNCSSFGGNNCGGCECDGY